MSTEKEEVDGVITCPVGETPVHRARPGEPWGRKSWTGPEYRVPWVVTPVSRDHD